LAVTAHTRACEPAQQAARADPSETTATTRRLSRTPALRSEDRWTGWHPGKPEGLDDIRHPYIRDATSPAIVRRRWFSWPRFAISLLIVRGRRASRSRLRPLSPLPESAGFRCRGRGSLGPCPRTQVMVSAGCDCLRLRPKVLVLTAAGAIASAPVRGRVFWRPRFLHKALIETNAEASLASTGGDRGRLLCLPSVPSTEVIGSVVRQRVCFLR
jgi:hypothetical protein